MKILVVSLKSSTKIFPVGFAYVISTLKRVGRARAVLIQQEIPRLCRGIFTLNIEREPRFLPDDYEIVATGWLTCYVGVIERVVQLGKSTGAVVGSYRPSRGS